MQNESVVLSPDDDKEQAHLNELEDARIKPDEALLFAKKATEIRHRFLERAVNLAAG